MDPSAADDALLAELATAFDEAARVPAGFVDQGKAAFDLRGAAAELAALTQDVTGAELAGIRSEPAALRSLTFVAGDVAIELEVTAEALVGQVVPPRAGEIDVEGPRGAIGSVPVDEVGWFAVRPAPTGPVRLHLRTADGAIRTEWTTL